MRAFFILLLGFFISQSANGQSAIPLPTKYLNDCYYQEIAIKNPILSDTLTKYLRLAEPFELPIMAVVTAGDTTVLYISAVISGNAVQNSPPSYLTSINGRQVAIYRGSESVIGLDSACLSKLVSHCRKFLHVDKVNMKEGVPPGTMLYYTHNPFRIKLLLVKDELVSIDNKYSNDKPFPFFKFSF